jgi:hypothetical protein
MSRRWRCGKMGESISSKECQQRWAWRGMGDVGVDPEGASN